MITTYVQDKHQGVEWVFLTGEVINEEYLRKALAQAWFAWSTQNSHESYEDHVRTELAQWCIYPRVLLSIDRRIII